MELPSCPKCGSDEVMETEFEGPDIWVPEITGYSCLVCSYKWRDD